MRDSHRVWNEVAQCSSINILYTYIHTINQTKTAEISTIYNFMCVYVLMLIKLSIGVGIQTSRLQDQLQIFMHVVALLYCLLYIQGKDV